MSLVINFEVAVILSHALRSDVLDDRLVRDDPQASHKESPSQQVSASAFLAQVAELLQQLPRRLPLDPLHQVARRNVWRSGHEQVDMFLAHVPLDNLDLQLRADVSHELPQADGYVRPQQLLAILGDRSAVASVAWQSTTRKASSVHDQDQLPISAG